MLPDTTASSAIHPQDCRTAAFARCYVCARITSHRTTNSKKKARPCCMAVVNARQAARHAQQIFFLQKIICSGVPRFSRDRSMMVCAPMLCLNFELIAPD